MKIPIACRSCFHEFAVSEELIGRRVKCPSCGEAVRVTGEDDDRSGSRRAGRSGPKAVNRRRKRRTSGFAIGLAMAGGFLAAGLAGVGIWLSMSGKTSPGGGMAALPFGARKIDVSTRKAEMEKEREKIYLKLINLYERIVKLTNETPDQQAVVNRHQEFQRLFDEEYELMVELSDAGGTEPPHDVPLHLAKFTTLHNEILSHILALDPQRIGKLSPVASLRWNIGSESKPNPFQRLRPPVRAWGKDCIVYVKLLNNHALAGPRHQEMLRLLKEQLGAEENEFRALLMTEARSYVMAFAPVPDVEAAAKNVTLGAISEMDTANRSFTLTLDLKAVPGSEPDPPPIQAAAPRQPSEAISAVQAARGQFKGFPEFKKPGPHMQVQFDSYNGKTPMRETLEKILRDFSAADFDSLQFDEPTMRFRVQYTGYPDLTNFLTALIQAGFQVTSTSRPSKEDSRNMEESGKRP